MELTQNPKATAPKKMPQLLTPGFCSNPTTAGVTEPPPKEIRATINANGKYVLELDSYEIHGFIKALQAYNNSRKAQRKAVNERYKRNGRDKVAISRIQTYQIVCP